MLRMKNFDSFDVHDARRHFARELTSLPPLWNHPKTVAPVFTLAQVSRVLRYEGGRFGEGPSSRDLGRAAFREQGSEELRDGGWHPHKRIAQGL
jgi:hypothetical protein